MIAFISTLLVLFAATHAAAVFPVAVTASGYQEPNRPEDSVDELSDTRWSCQGECWIEYDYGKVRHADGILVIWKDTLTRTQEFTLDISTNGRDWTTLFDGRFGPLENPEDSRFFVQEMDDDFRYLRITGYGNSLNDWNSLIEMYVTHPRDEPDYEEVGFAAITASNVVDGNMPLNTVDGNFKTFWTGSGDRPYLELELDGGGPIYSILVAWMNGRTRTQKYAIDISLDGENWERVDEGESSGQTLEYEHIHLEAFPFANYIRIVGLGNNSRIAASRKKISIAEVIVFVGCCADEMTDQVALR